MFKRIGGSIAMTTDRFEVMFRGRDNLVYIERLPQGQKREVEIYAEMLLGNDKTD